MKNFAKSTNNRDFSGCFQAFVKGSFGGIFSDFTRTFR